MKFEDGRGGNMLIPDKETKTKYYIVAFNKWWCDEYGFNTLEEANKFIEKNKDLTIKGPYTKPILVEDN